MPKSATERISVVFDLIASCALALDAAPMTRWPAGWVFPVDEHWQIVLNGQRTAIRWEAVEIPPFHAYVTFNGWPAGLFSPFGGPIANGREANEGTLIAALKKRLDTLTTLSTCLAPGPGRGGEE